jgi:hypothetical protein
MDVSVDTLNILAEGLSETQEQNYQKTALNVEDGDFDFGKASLTVYSV